MTRPAYRVVAPYLPFPTEAAMPHEAALQGFDWLAAITMMRASVEASCGCEVRVITDAEAPEVPGPCFRYRTESRRLMLWILEAALRYLESDDFDRDTIALDVDQLVYGDLGAWFASYMELGILIRDKPKGRDFALPILNGVQWWPLRGRAKLAGFYAQALDVARALPEDEQAWGADTVALVRLLEPLEPLGLVDRQGLRVRLIEADDVIAALNRVQVRKIAAGRTFIPSRPVLDFRATRKVHMAGAYRLAAALPAENPGMTHYWERIDGWFAFRAAYDQILTALPADRPSTFVELGTWMGRSTAYLGVEIINRRKPVTLVAVDLFQGSVEIAGTRRADAVVGSEAAFRKNLAPVAAVLGDRFRLMVGDSAASAAFFPDGEVDAVWVDAAHGYEFVSRDLAAWTAKIRPGGWFGGDDFRKCPGVAQAVTEHFGASAGVIGTPYWLIQRPGVA